MFLINSNIDSRTICGMTNKSGSTFPEINQMTPEDQRVTVKTW